MKTAANKSRLWALLIASGCFAFFFLVNTRMNNNRPLDELFNFGHIPLFGIVSLAILKILKHGRDPTHKRHYVISGACTALLGIVTECLQLFIPERSFTISDIFRDALGACTFLVFVYPFRSTHARMQKICRISCAGCIAVALIPVVLAITDSISMHKNFPVICSFENRLEVSRWNTQKCKITISRKHATHGEFSLKLNLRPGGLPGIATRYLPGDWQKKNKLACDIYLEGTNSLNMTLRIQDSNYNGTLADTYHEIFVLLPGKNSIEINLDTVQNAPAGRLMDLGTIAKMYIFSYKLQSYRTLYVDNIRVCEK